MSGFASVVLVEPSLSHLDRAFTYSVPDELPAAVGSHVRVPFRGRKRRGVVVRLLERSDVERSLPIAEMLGPGLPHTLVELAEWVSLRYLSTFGEALASVLPERVASEEGAAGAPARYTSAEKPELLRAYTNGGALVDSIQAGGGGFVWRPSQTESRPDAIAGLVNIATREERGVLVLVPDVRASDVARALRDMLGVAIASLGSDHSARERYRDWLALRDGSKHVAVGGRGAVFAPVRDLGLIVVDEESHVAYKEARAPRFHARTVAAERARRDDATLVLAGMPPSVEARAAASGKLYTFVSASRATDRARRPSVTVVDERTRLVPAGRTMTIAKEVLASGARVVILTHKAGDEAERVSERAFRILAPRKPALLDARTPSAQLNRALRSADCIVATPVIAKDTRPEGIGLVAIVEADAALAQPGFRTAEEAFATWWRTAGWAPRIVIETTNPKHPAIDALVLWDPDVLVRAETARRRELGYPPFAAVARIDVPQERARDVVAELGKLQQIEVLGPVEREGGNAVVVARARRRDTLLAALRPVVAEWRRRDEPMRVDVDPWEVLVPKWRS